MVTGLSLAGRMVAILLLLLVGIGLTGIAMTWWSRGVDGGVEARPPLPDQIAAIVDVLERDGLSRRDLLLRAVNSDDLRVTISAGRPQAVLGRRMPVAEWLIGQYLEALPHRGVEILVLPDGEAEPRWLSWVKGLAPGPGLPLRIAVPLTTGEYAIFETRGGPTQRVFGLPTGFGVGFLGAILGLMAILAIRREARPLADLSTALTRFSADAKPAPVTPRGAPDVRSLIEAVNAMQTRIASLLKGRTILLGAVSHDLKTYITRLRLRVEALDDDMARDKAVRDLNEMTQIIDSAIAVARGGAAIEMRELVDLRTLVANEVALRDGQRLTLLPLVVEPPRGSRRTIGRETLVLGDAVGLRRVIANILDNALRYATRADVSIAVSGAGSGLVSGGEFVLRVDDDGPGIPEAEREAIFEPFYRAEPSRNRSTGGSGLGLAIARQIVEAHGGRIAAETSPKGGARIAVALPIAVAQ
ncbi:MAG: two-component sensor histidine kinase [Hyphomicrobiaceae bacterium]|nr:two-component sensor histidine kinase [Hyphomicrobiaceae bacterium]